MKEKKIRFYQEKSDLFFVKLKKKMRFDFFFFFFGKVKKNEIGFVKFRSVFLKDKKNEI